MVFSDIVAVISRLPEVINKIVSQTTTKNMTEFLLATDYPSARIFRQTAAYEFIRIVSLRKGWPCPLFSAFID